jgi:hypothetical protein
VVDQLDTRVRTPVGVMVAAMVIAACMAPAIPDDGALRQAPQ